MDAGQTRRVHLPTYPGDHRLGFLRHKDEAACVTLRQSGSTADSVCYPGLLPPEKGQGWEDRLQAQFEAMAKEEFGIEIDDTVFLG
jgi:aarF domain-containing kinase